MESRIRSWVLRARRVVAVGLIASVAAHAAPAPSGEYVRGYADAVLRQVFGLDDYTLEVGDGEIRLMFDAPPKVERDTLERALLAIEGVERVEILDRGDPSGVRQARDDTPEPTQDVSDWQIFPQRELFEPLLADPRWPHFSAALEWYTSDQELDRVVATSFGETFALLRSPESEHGRLELGFQAGVFSVFDLDSESFDLVNSDFIVGLTLAHQLGDLTSMLRVYHQSSHLGDEFLLRNRVDRVNLSFEVVDFLMSYDPTTWLRLYGGGGLLVHREPDLDRWLAQAGVELVSPEAYLGGHVRPLAAVDLQFRQESDWRTDLSTRFGFQIEHATLQRLQVQILGQYYRGRSPNGQFYERRIETLGVGVHLGF